MSDAGLLQARQLGERYAAEEVNAVYCSDLQRSYQTAKIAFKDRNMPITQDRRLREWDYGDLAGFPKKQVDAEKRLRIDRPFPNGESCAQVATRVKGFLDDLKASCQAQHVVIIGHSAVLYSLEHLINCRPLEELVARPVVWQPGWSFRL